MKELRHRETANRAARHPTDAGQEQAEGVARPVVRLYYKLARQDFRDYRCPLRAKVVNGMKYWEIIADNPSKAGWSWGCVSAVDSRGRTIFVADAHREDSQRFIVRADEKLTAFVELESAIRAYRKSHYVVFLQINR